MRPHFVGHHSVLLVVADMSGYPFDVGDPLESTEDDGPITPHCDICMTDQYVKYTGEGSYSSEFWCENCGTGWAEPT